MSIISTGWQAHPSNQHLIDLALSEDLGMPYQDLTTMTLFSEQCQNLTQASIISKQPAPIILCGLPLIAAVLEKLSQQWEVQSTYHDGDMIPTHATIMTIVAPAQILLMTERILLNFLQHLSAIASLTREFVTKIEHTKACILDTRKTLPGFRYLDKYAVRCGGGVNHRNGLYDAIMIKDTHIDLLGSIEVALQRLPEDITSRFPVIVEVRNRQELRMVLEKGLQKVTRVLLDNMTLKEMSECVLMCDSHITTEVSGNINLDNVVAIAETGVDFISIGKLTHSAGSVDLSMKCDR